MKIRLNLKITPMSMDIKVVFHRFKDEADAIHMVKELRKMDWDKSKVDLILDEMSLN